MKKYLFIALTLFVITVIPVVADEQGNHAANKPIGQAERYWLLNRACFYGDDMGARMLLDAGADVDGTKDYMKFMKTHGIEPSWPINQASANGHLEVVKLLLDRGAKVDSVEGEGDTALLIATRGGHTELVRILLEAGADRAYKGVDGTALDIARAKDLGDIVTLLATSNPKANKGTSVENLEEKIGSVVDQFFVGENVERKHLKESTTISLATMMFQIHRSDKTGKFAELPHEEIGPKAEGFVITLTHQNGSYEGSAVYPQTFTRPYWKTFGTVIPIEANKNHIHVSFSYGRRVPEDFIAAITKTLESNN